MNYFHFAIFISLFWAKLITNPTYRIFFCSHRCVVLVQQLTLSALGPTYDEENRKYDSINCIHAVNTFCLPQVWLDSSQHILRCVVQKSTLRCQRIICGFRHLEYEFNWTLEKTMIYVWRCRMLYLLDSYEVPELSEDCYDSSSAVYCQSCCAPEVVAIDECRVALHVESHSNFDGVGRGRNGQLDWPNPFRRSIHAVIILLSSHHRQIILLRQAFLRKWNVEMCYFRTSRYLSEQYWAIPCKTRSRWPVSICQT